MWSSLRLGFVRLLRSGRAEERALHCLQDLYRFAYFLVGSQTTAEELVQAAYQEIWRQRSCGERVGDWRLSLLRALLRAAEGASFSRAETAPEEAPPLWNVLSGLDFNARAVILLDVLDLPLRHMALVVNVPEALVAQRLEAARTAFLSRLGGS